MQPATRATATSVDRNRDGRHVREVWQANRPADEIDFAREAEHRLRYEWPSSAQEPLPSPPKV